MGSALVRGCSTEKPCGSTHESRHQSEATLVNGASANTRIESSSNERKTGRLRSVVFIQVVPAAMDGDGPPTKHTSHSVTARLQELLQQLDDGRELDQSELRDSLSLALLALSDVEYADPSEDDVLNSVSNTQVRAWLSTTFTRHERVVPPPISPLTPKERFKAVANTIIIGKYFENIVREPAQFTGPQYPPEVATLLQEHLDNWEFPIFRLEGVSNVGGVANTGALRFVGFELFKRHNLFDRCSISPLIFDQFLTRIEADYGSHGNPYHNATHGADVAQTVHYFIQHSSLKAHLTHLDILSLILSALIHDVNHPGTSNAFQIAQMSEYALMYNDRSVLENHHLHHTFRLMKEKQFDILSGLKSEEYKLVRGLVIDMVLATDMSTHFEQLKNAKQTLTCSNSGSQLLTTDRSKTFSLILHLADISHPGKAWAEHLEWSDRLCEEFFRQGDQERSLGFAISPLCDRSNTDVPESQLGFIEYIVAPSFDVCGSVFEMIASEAPLSPNNHNHKSFDLSHDHMWAWSTNIDNNKAMWRERKVCKAKGGCRGSVISKSSDHTHLQDDTDKTIPNGEVPTRNGRTPSPVTMTTCEVEQLPSDLLVSTDAS